MAWSARALVFLAVILAAGCDLQRRLDLPEPRARVGSPETVTVTTRDGAPLATDVYLPRPLEGSDISADGPWPTILVRTPYARAGYPMFIDRLGALMAQYGYAVVIQDVRGRFDSGGEWSPLIHELDDSADTVKWLLAQPWCSGELGLLGASYLTITAWATASQFPDAVKAMVLNVGGTDPYQVAYERGMAKLDLLASWALAMHGPRFTLRDVRFFDEMVGAWPPDAGDDQTIGPVPFYDDILRHPSRDAFWERGFGDPAPTTSAPTLMITGWYDIFLPSQLRDWARLGSAGQSQLIVGPWTHVWGAFEDPAINHGKAASARPIIDRSLDFFDQHLQGRPPRHAGARVQTFAIGAGEWVASDSWPPPEARRQRLYLAGEPGARACRGQGRLEAEAPSAQGAAARFTYDPRRPVPTLGGALLGWVLGAEGLSGGPQDQSELCGRADILTFETPPLTAPLTLAGPLGAHLVVESSAEDTAFTAKLVDVAPAGGPAVNIQDGIATLAYQASTSAPQRTPPGTAVALDIDLRQTHWVVAPGHRLRLEVSSSNFPQYHRHPNVFGPFAQIAEPVVAEQTVRYGAEHPSWLWLSVQPPEEASD